MPIDPLYADSTNAYLKGFSDIPLPAAPVPAPSTGIGSIGLATSLGAVQGAARLAGAAADFGAAVGQLTTGPDSMAFDPVALAASDQQENIARAKGGHLFESQAGANLYTLADMLKPDPTNTTRTDQTVQGAVSGLVQIVPAAVVGGPLAGAAVGATSFGLGAAEDLKRQGVDVGTRTAVGGVEGAFGAAGAVLPAAGSTIASTLGLVAVGGPGMTIAQGAAERAILRNAGYDHLADQINPLDPTNLAASTLMAGAFGAAHAVGVARGGRAAASPAATLDPATPLASLDLAARRALPFDSPVLSSYITEAAQREGVPPGLMLGLIHAGERSNSGQVSPKGAAGVAQMMPDNLTKFGVSDPTDPIQSIDGMARYLAATQKQYGGNIEAMIADYNGGPKQAAAVLRGEAPPAAETAAYLTRVTDYLNNRAIDDFRFNPTPDQVDAALTARGQRIVDDAYVFGTPDDVNGMATHQDAFELAARQMDEGGYPDVSRYFTPDDATRAAALEGLIADTETQHTDLSIAAANLADPGAIAAVRSEIDALNAAAPDTSPAAVKEKTREIQAEGIKFKTAERQAQQRIDALQADHEAQLTRLRAIIQRNAEAQRANDQLPALNDRLTALRKQRAALDVPATRRTQLADFVANMARAQRETPDVPGRAAPDPIAEAAGTTPPPVVPRGVPPAGEPPRAAAATSSGDEAPASAIETNLRAQAEVSPELPVELDATRGEFSGTLADAMKVIDEEHAASIADSQLMDVAANCFITTLG
ncbi:transglycosylase SLT domain-containing protein [Burkholderia plantarii]|uniref:lytic transglycosylase domain-containing protein n=1 Tax=Burkholderia plantarii TaxID=41899 RepID=UPI00272A5EE8|nr:transglycosylase SLT domain-containing protein [Burkholderia plantarii]WLE60283.1 transglycosylase SLT domain-containing protein [Burkholderia plantarii]